MNDANERLKRGFLCQVDLVVGTRAWCDGVLCLRYGGLCPKEDSNLRLPCRFNPSRAICHPRRAASARAVLKGSAHVLGRNRTSTRLSQRVVFPYLSKDAARSAKTVLEDLVLR